MITVFAPTFSDISEKTAECAALEGAYDDILRQPKSSVTLELTALTQAADCLKVRV